MGAHLIDGEFQSDKYPTTPRGKVPLSVKDKTAQDLLWLYAKRRRAVDAEFAYDLVAALRIAGYDGPGALSELQKAAVDLLLGVVITRMEICLSAMIERDGSLDAAILGKGIGIRYLLAAEIVHAAKEARKFIARSIQPAETDHD